MKYNISSFWELTMCSEASSWILCVLSFMDSYAAELIREMKRKKVVLPCTLEKKDKMKRGRWDFSPPSHPAANDPKEFLHAFRHSITPSAL